MVTDCSRWVPPIYSAPCSFLDRPGTKRSGAAGRSACRLQHSSPPSPYSRTPSVIPFADTLLGVLPFGPGWLRSMWCTPRPVAAIYDEPIVVYSILVIVYGADAVETTTILDMHALLILSHISHPSMRLICKSGAFAPMVRPACVSST